MSSLSCSTEILNMIRVTIDGTKIANISHLHTVLARELLFPEWYGRNLDALYDCLRDLESKTELVIFHPEVLEETLGRKSKGFFRTLEDAEKASSVLTVVYK